MRVVTAGESHGPQLTALIEGVPAGVPLDVSAIDADLVRRQGGYGRGGRQAIEHDHVQVLSGVRFGRTIGSPVTLVVENRDFAHWEARMAVQGDAPVDLVREVTPRPGHADLVGALKAGTGDCRDILERASARETACRVAAGGVAKALLSCVGVEVTSYVTSIGGVDISPVLVTSAGGLFDPEIIEVSPVRCPDLDASGRMCAAIDAARSAGESLGGTYTVVATGLVAGLGGYATSRERLTSRLGAALFSIPAMKGVEFGLGIEAARRPGSQVHDEIVRDAGFANGGGFSRRTNNAGGLEGGMTTGQPLVVRVAMKPIPTLMTPLDTVRLDTLEPAKASCERSDVCAVPAAAVVAEAEVALVLADAYSTRFGVSCVADLCANLCAYRERMAR
jgi:chorismate synthase